MIAAMTFLQHPQQMVNVLRRGKTHFYRVLTDGLCGTHFPMSSIDKNWPRDVLILRSNVSDDKWALIYPHEFCLACRLSRSVSMITTSCIALYFLFFSHYQSSMHLDVSGIRELRETLKRARHFNGNCPRHLAKEKENCRRMLRERPRAATSWRNNSYKTPIYIIIYRYIL